MHSPLAPAVTLVPPLTVAAALAVTACTSPTSEPEADRSVSAAAAADCSLDVSGFEGDASHIDLAEAPPADELYDQRPATGGPHTPEWLSPGIYSQPIEERSAVHNLEHGAVAIWFDADADPAQVDALVAWAQRRNTGGLLDERTGAGLLVAPWEGRLDPPFAFRAWGVAADCAAFDADFGDAFLLDHFGAAGAAPEGSLGADPADVIPDPGT